MMPSISSLAKEVGGFLRQKATVYTPDALGAYTVVAKSDLACRLSVLSMRGLDSSTFDRAELANRRHLMWDANYVMPADCQLDVLGERWNPAQGTQEMVVGLDGTTTMYGRMDLVRVEE